MRKVLFFNSLLIGSLAVLSACSSGDEMTVETPPPNHLQTWNATVTAVNSDIEDIGDGENDATGTTRAIVVGGHTDRYGTVWDDGDIVKVYKGATYVGQMTPKSEFYGTITAELEGTLTGPFAVDDVLTLYLPGKAIDLTGQTGTLQGVSSKCFQTQTATVTVAQDNILALSDVNMEHRVSYGRFYLKDEEGGARLHPSRLEIHALSGPDIVLKVDEEGNVTETGDLVITPESYEGEYPAEPYVAFYCDYAEPFTYTLKATVGEDIYVGPLDIEGQNAITTLAAKGKLNNYRRFMRKTTPMTALTIQDMAAQTFTGYPVTPEPVVKDGVTTLTAGTDYDVESYSSNTGVGTATVTVKGRADALARAETKYLGTASKTFSIVQATPVIDMSSETMTLVYGKTGQTRIPARVFIDNNANGTYDTGTDYDITALCSITYQSSDPSVAVVNSTTGAVTPAAAGAATITVSVLAADNWTLQTKTYTANVEVEPTTGNSVNDWNATDPEDTKVFAE